MTQKDESGAHEAAPTVRGFGMSTASFAKPGPLRQPLKSHGRQLTASSRVAAVPHLLDGDVARQRLLLHTELIDKHVDLAIPLRHHALVAAALLLLERDVGDAARLERR